MVAGVGRGLACLVLVGIVATACSETVQPDAVAPTSSAAVPTTTERACGVSDLLVPECGAWFGVSSPSADGSYDYQRGLEEYEALVDTPADILHFYERGARPFPTAADIAMAERPGRPRSILYHNWKPAPELTWREIASGAADDSIESVADGLRSYPHRLFLTIHHEPEDDVDAAPGSGMTTADYVAMYRHVVSQLRRLGVDNVVYVMGYMGFERWAPIVDELFPGDDVVDWIAYDPYGFSEHDTLASMLDDDAADWPGFYSWATQKSPGTPIMLGEWGFDLRTNDRAPELVSDLPDVLPTRFPMIKAVVYWNDLGRVVDARLAGDAEHAASFASAFAAAAADPYFNLTSTAAAP